MSKHGAIKRYLLIIEKIRKQNFPAFKELRNHLFLNGFEISDRTIQRDIEQIRYDFGIEIKFNRLNNGYYIDYEESINADNFFRSMEIIHTAEFLTESIKDSKNAQKYILFETAGELKGTENLSVLLSAIKEQKEIEFIHENFINESKKKYVLKPLLLKEFQNRWYLIGDRKSKILTFGIDRINNLKITDRKFRSKTGKKLLHFYDNVIGVAVTDKIENVILSFTPLQGKYIKTLPLHKSQIIIRDDANELRIKLNIAINYEFKQKILMFGDTVKVLQPKWFTEDIKTTIQTALNNYK